MEAAQDYYAAAVGNYIYTYDALASDSQSRFTGEEWAAADTALGSDDASYDIYSTELVDDTTATVGLTVTTANGSGDDRTTLFVYENGEWKHELTQREYDLFAGASATTTSATASASATPSAPANGFPNPDRNAPRLNASGNASQSDGGGGLCPQGGHWVGKDGPGVGDSDGCASE